MEELKVEMNKNTEQDAKVKRPYAVWNVNGQEYKLKLTIDAIEKLETKYNKNLLSLIDDGIPPVSTMISIIHGGMQKYNHGMGISVVKDIYDDYVEEGGNQLELLTDVLMPLFTVSGFFPREMGEEMEQSLEEIKNTNL